MAPLSKKEKRIRRHKRIRAKITGTAQRPRLSVFRSNKHLYVQLLDDETHRVLAASSDMQSKNKKGAHRVKEVAQSIGEKAKKQNIERIVFDRGGYKYHGRIKVLAEELRSQGLKF